jgi:hypothetical protein
MFRLLSFTLVLLIWILCPILSLADKPAPGADDWKYDVVHRKIGDSLRGLVVDHDSEWVSMTCITRKIGSATLLFKEKIARKDVSRLELLEDKERAQLAQRVDSLRSERTLLAETLQALDPRSKKATFTEKLDLTTVDWASIAGTSAKAKEDKVLALRYASKHFTLVADSRKELTQLAAIHLEQIFAAYTRALPSRATKATPTTIVLTRSLGEYQNLAKARGLNLLNPAFYDPNKNEVVCGSDLERMCEEMDKIRDHHTKLRGDIKERQADLVKLYRNRVPPELLAPMRDAEKAIVATEKRNEKSFSEVRERLFRRLYHEAFHAYLATFVYPPKDGTLPLWFNEGLAQIFESAIVEAGELRIGHADEERRKAVQTAVSKGTLLSLSELLKSTPKSFQIAHTNDRYYSDQYYLASWALAFYLTFEYRLVGTKKLDDYVVALHRGGDPLSSFREFIDSPLDEFEKQWHKYLAGLRINGTSRP